MKKWMIIVMSMCILIACSTLTMTVIAEPSIRLPTQPITMRTVYGSNSWFIMNLSDIPAGYDVINSPPTYLGWCVQVAVNMTPYVNHNVLLYSSYDPNMPENFQSPNWDKVNYVINNKQGYDRQTIQEVIWYFVCNDPLPMNNTDAYALAAVANTSGEGFIPTFGEKIAILCEVVNGNYPVQRTFFEFSLRSALPLGDLVWNDINTNGIQDNGEPGIQGVTVRLLDESNTILANTTTNSSGYYSFSGFDEGNYSLQFVLPSQYHRFSPIHQGIDDLIDSDVNQTTGKTPLINAFSGINDMSWDAGMYTVEEPGDPGDPGTPTPPPENPNRPPTADGTAGEPYIVLLGQMLIFNGSRSYDSDGFINTWHWTLGDGTTKNGVIVNHTYTNSGTYLVTLTVTDDDGATDTYTTNAMVRLPNRPPQPPTLTGYATAGIEDTYVLRLVTTDPNGDDVRFFISWGDDTQNTTGFLPSAQNTQISHRWKTWGFYTIQAYAEDSYDNAASNISSIIVAIDVCYVGNFGYLIDTDSISPFDTFYSNLSQTLTKAQRQQTGIYLIDTDGDDNYDIQYDPATDTYRQYPEALSPSYTMLIVGVSVVILLLLLIGFILRRRQK